jgi:hypothetical protein
MSKEKKEEAVRIVGAIVLNCGNGKREYYKVGKDGVTKIIPRLRNGEMAPITYYEIWKGDKLYCDMHRFDVVYYKN